jgi:hypothetical protein
VHLVFWADLENSNDFSHTMGYFRMRVEKKKWVHPSHTFLHVVLIPVPVFSLLRVLNVSLQLSEKLKEVFSCLKCIELACYYSFLTLFCIAVTGQNRVEGEDKLHFSVGGIWKNLHLFFNLLQTSDRRYLVPDGESEL